jgi:hypothetical protein
MNELDQILRQDALQQSSATRIQSAVRNRRATNETIKRAKEKQAKINAATKIQTAVRNHNALNETMKRAKQKQEIQIKETIDNAIENMKIQDAASTIQKAIKSKKARAELKQNKELKTISDSVVNDMQNQIRKQQEQFINAGTKIQKVVRGHKVRKQLPELMEEADRQAIINKINQVEQRANRVNNAASTLQSAMRNKQARSILRQKKVNKGKEIAERIKQEQYNTYLQDEAASNFGALSKGVVKQQKKALQQQLKQVQGHQLLQDIKSDNAEANFGYLSGKTLQQQRKGIKQQIKQNQETRDKQMEAAIKKYNKIGDIMATRNDSPMVLGETAPSRFIQSAARLRKKALQSKISHVDTRVNLATKQQKEAIIQKANLGIKRMDNIIKKKSEAGRPRTRSDQETAAQSSPASRRSSRLSMLSTSSTLGSFTPKKL